MTDLRPAFSHEGSLANGFHLTSHAEVEDLAFLNYGTITQEQIDMDNSESFVDVDDSTSSDSSEDETGQESCSDSKQLALDVKVLKEACV